MVGTVVAVGTAAVETVVVVGSIVAAGSIVVVASAVVAIFAVDIAGLGLVVVASFNPFSTLLHIRLIHCVYFVQRDP